jgi:hypothetical protein
VVQWGSGAAIKKNLLVQAFFKQSPKPVRTPEMRLPQRWCFRTDGVDLVEFPNGSLLTCEVDVTYDQF